MAAESLSKVKSAEAVETIIKAMDKGTSNVDLCTSGCEILISAAHGDDSLQKTICEKGGVAALLKVLRKYIHNPITSEKSCSAIMTILSSPKIRSVHCTPEVIRVIGDYYEKHKDSEDVKQFLTCLKKEKNLMGSWRHSEGYFH